MSDAGPRFRRDIRCPGRRCRASLREENHHLCWRTQTHRPIAPIVLDGAMYGLALLAYVEQVLVPPLKHGDIASKDDLPAHKPVAVREASKRPAPNCASCRPTARTSIQSRWLSPISRQFSRRPQLEPSTISGALSALPSSACLQHMNDATDHAAVINPASISTPTLQPRPNLNPLFVTQPALMPHDPILQHQKAIESQLNHRYESTN